MDFSSECISIGHDYIFAYDLFELNASKECKSVCVRKITQLNVSVLTIKFNFIEPDANGIINGNSISTVHIIIDVLSARRQSVMFQYICDQEQEDSINRFSFIV